MKIFINAWTGPWGWRAGFYNWARLNPEKFYGLDLVDDISEADVVFNADLSSWILLDKCSKHARIVCNVLDFGEWNGEWDPHVDEYVKTMKDRGARFTAISDKVIGQLHRYYDIDADMFYYPSQIETAFQKLTRPSVKPIFTTFARLGDPGKAVAEAIDEFDKSGLAKEGWKYRLIGPERPPVEKLPNGVFYMGYIPDVASLIMMLSQSAYILMPSRGEGLGLPIIEGALLARPFVARNIDPPISIFKKVWDPNVTFTDDDEMRHALINAAHDFKSENYMYKASYGYSIAAPWLRESAFESLVNYLRRV